MFQNSTAPRNGVPKLTVVRKAKNAKNVGNTAKLVFVKIVNNKPVILLPPPQEQYIKAKKHDFL